MCDEERWLLGATTGGEQTTRRHSTVAGSAAVAVDCWDVAGAVAACAAVPPATGTVAALPTLRSQQDLKSCNYSNFPGWSQIAQCSKSWLLSNETEVPVTLTLIMIIKWICISVFCQFYRFLARFSGRRRVRLHSSLHLHSAHPHVQLHSHSDQRQQETEEQQRHREDSQVCEAQEDLLVMVRHPSRGVRRPSRKCVSDSPLSPSPSFRNRIYNICCSLALALAAKMRPSTIYRVATLILVATTLLGSADACSSRSTPKPRSPSPTARPNVTFHTYACPPAYAAWYCLNGATCFTVKIGESLLYNCECADGYMGQRCEFKDLDGSYLPSRQKVMLEKASIAGGATIATVLVVVVLMALFMHQQRRRKELRASAVDSGIPDLENHPFRRSQPYVPHNCDFTANTSFTPTPHPGNNMEMMFGADVQMAGNPLSKPQPITRLTLMPPNHPSPVMLVSAQVLQRAAEP